MSKMKKVVFTLAIIMLLSVTTNVEAGGFNYSTGGETFSSGGCDGCAWVYVNEGLGVRVTLHKYDGKKLQSLGSVDLLNDPSRFGTSQMYMANKDSKYYYINKKGTDSVEFNRKATNFRTFKEFGLSNIDTSSESLWGKKLSTEISKYFGSNNNKIIEKIATLFGEKVNDEELSKYYLVVEPTIVFFNRVKSFYTYGTGYEYMSVKDILNSSEYTSATYKWGFWDSQGITIVDYLYNGMYVEKDSSKLYTYEGKKDGRYDYYNFVNQKTKKNALVVATSTILSGKSDSKLNNFANKDYPYGITVFWLGYNAVNKTCKTTCSGKTGDALLKCAENFCSKQTTVKDKNAKEKCILNDCNYTYTKLKCGTNPKKNGIDTECAATTSSNKQSCEIVDTKDYSYKIECKTNSNVTYPTTLPTTLIRGQSFEYMVKLGGNKTCTVTFDSALWKFNYASSYTNAERQNYITAINDFNTKINLDSHYYDSSNGNISIVINERKEGKNNSVNKQLMAGENYAEGDKKVTVTSSTTNISSYHSNKTITQNIKTYKTDSSNSSFYELPGVCISAVDNVTIKEGNKCDNGLGPYNKYYTGLDSDITTNQVVTTVVQNVAGLDVNNKCNYTIDDGGFDDKLSCYIETITDSNQSGNTLINNEDIKFMLYAVNRNKSKTIRYNIGTTTKKIDDSFNNKKIYTITKNSVKDSKKLTIYGTVTDGKYIVTCKKEVILNPQTCKWNITKNAAKDETTIKIKNVTDPKAKYYIKNSTSSEWMNIQQRTISNKTTITLEGKVVTSTGTYYCSYNNIYAPPDDPPVSKKCKELYKPTEYKKIKDYCAKYWKEDGDNYSSYEDCYISCSNNGDICKKKYECSDVTNIKQYCKTNYHLDGYSTVGDCINDCSCTSMGYYYRTISTDKPFPQREPNYNWLGYEEYITNDVYDTTSSTVGSPEYEIVLDSKRIDKIQSNTAKYNSKSGNDAYGDYAREDKVDMGSYKSKFIHVDDTNSGGFKSYFTYIEGSKTS